MLKKGMSHREIEKKLGLVGDRPVHQLLMRERRKEVQGLRYEYTMSNRTQYLQFYYTNILTNPAFGATITLTCGQCCSRNRSGDGSRHLRSYG